MLALQLALAGLASAALTCYDSSRSQIDETKGYVVPCQPDAQVSACCRKGFACLSNGLCEWTEEAAQYYNTSYFTNYYYMGCTDSTLQDPLCRALSTCSNLNIVGDGLSNCGGTNYCCYGLGGCDCNNSTQVFSLSGGSVVTTLPLPGATSSTSSTTATSTATSTMTTTASSSTPTQTGTNGGSGGGSSNTTAIGAGVGVGVAVVILGIAASWWFFRRRYKRKQQQSTIPTAPMYGGSPYAEEKPAYGDVMGPNAYGMKPVQHIAEAPTSPAVSHRYGPAELSSHQH